MASYRVYMRLSVVLLSWCWTRGENCYVNPECICYKDNKGTSVFCDPTCGPNTPKFSASSVQFLKVIITGIRDIKNIQDGSFQGLTSKHLAIQKTGISDITCNAWSGLENTLTSLYLDNNYLTSVPSCSLLRLSKLDTLKFDHNNITVISTEAFRRLSNLSYLTLHNNKVANIEANAFNGLTKLEYLYLEHNQITHMDGSAYRGLKSLTHLGLSWNRLSVLHPRVFSGLNRLRHLDLDNNNIISLDSTLFQDLTNLWGLYIRNNRICSLPERVFMYNTELDDLLLQGNCLNSLHENLFRTNSKLYGLNLDGNYLSTISPGIFRNLSNLIVLSLQGNKLTEIDENIFNGCPNIERVYLNNNSIHMLHDCSFRNLPRLSTLDLSENNLKRIDSTLCDNCPELTYLIFSQNHISFMQEMSLSNLPRLYQLKLDRNNLSSSSWKWLLKVISRVPTTRLYLDLSHNPIQAVPPKLFNSSKRFHIALRNCSLDIVPYGLTNSSFSGYPLEISSNNLKTFGTAHNPQFTSSESLNMSYNSLQSFNILSSGLRPNLRNILLANNSIQLPIFIRVLWKYTDIDYVDLSSNNIQNVTQFPINVFRSGNTDTVNACDDYRYLSVGKLNLSRNGISYISPQACLGIVYTLDLSYNQLSVFGELMPSNNSSRVRLQHLYMSGNNIHQVSPDAFVGLEQLYTLDFRSNNIHSLQFLEKKLKASSLRYAYFTENPIKCDCLSTLLRNGSIPNKLGSARCQSPASARGYLVYCYPVPDCPVQLEVTVPDDIREICEKDFAPELSNLTVTSSDSIAAVFWTKTGPGKISGYKMELRELNSGRVVTTLLIHPEMSNTTVSNLRFQHSYNICLSAQLHGRRVSDEVCQEVIPFNKTEHTTILNYLPTSRKVSGVETFCAGLDVVIGLSVSLALCLITTTSLVVCALCRRNVSQQKESRSEFGHPQVNQSETTQSNTNMYQHNMKPYENNGELYEDLDMREYVNFTGNFSKT